jgi:hypothetical protein
MDIDKAEMTLAYMNKDNPKYFNKFIGFIDEIGNFCVSRLKIDPNYRADVKQIAVEHAFRKMDHFNPDHGSAAYSFFYKVILRRCLYELRDINKKKNRMPNICSLDKLYNSCSDDSDDPTQIPIDITKSAFISDVSSDIEEDDVLYNPADDLEIVMINNKPYNRMYAFQKAKEAKTIVRREKLILRRNRLFSLKTEEYFKIEDEFVRMVCVQIVENKIKKTTCLRRSK